MKQKTEPERKKIREQCKLCGKIHWINDCILDSVAELLCVECRREVHRFVEEKKSGGNHESTT